MMTFKQYLNSKKTVTQVLAQRKRRENEKVQRAREVPNVLPQSNDNRSRNFFITEIQVQMEILQELKKIREMLEKK